MRPHKVKVCLMGAWPVALLGIGLGVIEFIPARSAYSWGYVDDVAQGHLLAMEKGKIGESYIIAGPCHTLAEMLHMAEKITGVPGNENTKLHAKRIRSGSPSSIGASRRRKPCP